MNVNRDYLGCLRFFVEFESQLLLVLSHTVVERLVDFFLGNFGHVRGVMANISLAHVQGHIRNIGRVHRVGHVLQFMIFQFFQRKLILRLKMVVMDDVAMAPPMPRVGIVWQNMIFQL